MAIRLHHVGTLLDLCVQTPRQVRNWPSVLYHDVRMRLGNPGIPSGSEIRLRNGATFAIYPRSAGLYSVFSDVYLQSCYDRKPPFRIRTTDTVIDIGANVGFFTIKAAQQASRGRVYAFEPCPPHYEMLGRNVGRNPVSNASISPEAIWDSDGTLELRYSMASGNLNEPTATSVFDIGGTSVATVPTVSLNRVFERENIDLCDFLKLDCEGAEYEILYAASDQVLKSIDRIAPEWHKFDASHDPEALARYLQASGYDISFKTKSHGKTGYIFAAR